jgi:hypothetical protein
MNRQLDQTDTPFGAVVKPLGFHRRTLGVDRLFAPEKRAAVLPHILVRYRALLLDQKGAPFSLVAESYTAALLDLASPPPLGEGDPEGVEGGQLAISRPVSPSSGLRPYSPQKGERINP